ncbi:MULTISPECIES: hypothetical protein [unclassified Geomicrobium]|uniref:hypothetical protein n=1 Tax=unclassified Geomicrobium TaxID=2628951 RepID=UPI00045ED8DB|nr:MULTISPECIES: hypothetical protein [unclassified Geomicrobium]EZH67026.1 hypothetical protein DH09_03545 [Bacillaceae bacterium JMAK1]GAK00933.1 hypothetical protein JCM19055_4063 [Geomicrobium sp. JCM 19055]GAK10168.1 hypothetical protein JCM19038_4054 [Geomicrobium sp. JCM 19038]
MSGDKKKSNKNQLTPEQIAVIAGLLTNVLSVRAILVDRNQTVEIIIQGDLSKKKDKDKMFKEVADMRFGDVWDLFMNTK